MDVQKVDKEDKKQSVDSPAAGCKATSPVSTKKKNRTQEHLSRNRKLYISGAIIAVAIAAWLIPSPINMSRSPITKFIDAESNPKIEVDTVGMVLADGSVYDGNLLKGTTVREGYGRLRTKAGIVYEGEWTDNHLDYGSMTGSSFVYRGHFNHKLQRDGFGIISYNVPKDMNAHWLATDGAKTVSQYIGNWDSDEKQGLGRTVFADGKMEFGEYHKGTFKPAKGADYEVGQRVYGMDISHHQNKIDWNNLSIYCNSEGVANAGKHKKTQYRQPVFFVYVKATEGADYIDPTYAIRVIEAERHGVTKGAYHFFRIASDIKEQVKNFVNTVSWTKGDMPPALDVEDEKMLTSMGTERLLTWVYTWLEDVESQMHVRPIIYTTEGIRDKYLKKDPRFNKYQCWIARYREKEPENKVWRIWQFTETGRVSGYKGPIDGNIYKGGYAAFQEYLDRQGS